MIMETTLNNEELEMKDFVIDLSNKRELDWMQDYKLLEIIGIILLKIKFLN
jgi:hypothetical protein